MSQVLTVRNTYVAKFMSCLFFLTVVWVFKKIRTLAKTLFSPASHCNKNSGPFCDKRSNSDDSVLHLTMATQENAAPQASTTAGTGASQHDSDDIQVCA